jgi:hypothetical protein
MKKIEDGTYRAMRMDASGYVYGDYKGFRGANYHIKVRGQDNWITPIKIKTLMYRVDGKWVSFPVAKDPNYK